MTSDDSGLKKCNRCGRVYLDEADFLTNTSRWRQCSDGHLWFNCSCDSTLVLLKGRYSWYSPEKMMSAKAGAVFHKLIAMRGHLPVLESGIMRAQSMLDDPKATAADIANSIKPLPFVASELLKIANNLREGTSAIKTLDHALIYVGRKTASDLLSLAGLRSFKFACAFYTHDRYWQEAYLCALISEALSRRFAPFLSPDEAFIAGNLCNVGKILHAICLPKEIDQIFQSSKDPKTQNNWQMLEKKHHAVDHCVLGEVACCLWGLPAFILDSAVNHHTGPSEGDSIELVDVIAFANQMSHWINLQPERLDEGMLELYREKFALSKEMLDDLGDQLVPLRKEAQMFFI